MTQPNDPRCGTPAGYQAHQKRTEDPCAKCRRARADYIKQRRQDPKIRALEVRREAARQRALSRLARIHPALYANLYAEELSK